MATIVELYFSLAMAYLNYISIIDVQYITLTRCFCHYMGEICEISCEMSAQFSHAILHEQQLGYEIHVK